MLLMMCLVVLFSIFFIILYFCPYSLRVAVTYFRKVCHKSCFANNYPVLFVALRREFFDLARVEFGLIEMKRFGTVSNPILKSFRKGP